MSDLVEHMREVAALADCSYPATMREAADEITRLRAEVEKWRSMYRAWLDRAKKAEKELATLRAPFEAADEITRLRAALARVEIYLTRGGASRSRIADIARAALTKQKENDHGCGCAPGDCAADEIGGKCGRSTNG